MEKREYNKKLSSRALITPGTFNLETKTFDVVFASETPVRRSFFNPQECCYEIGNEILSCDPKSVRTERMSDGLPVFDNHPWDKSASMQLGRCSNIRFENKTLVGTITLGARADEALISDIKSGIISGISVGYNVYSYSREQTLDETPTYRSNDWEPFEVSFAPVQADIDSKIRSMGDASVIEDNNVIITKTRKEMEDEKTVATATQQPAAQQNVEEIRAAAAKQQKERLDAILKSTRAAKLDDSKAIEFFNSEKTIEEIRQAVIDEFVKEDPKTANVTITDNSVEKRSAIENALMHRISPSVVKLEEGKEFRGMTLMEISKEMLAEKNVNTRGMSKAQVADCVFGSKRDMSTSDFPLLLEGLANKMLRSDYQYAPEYWDKIAKQTSVSDFKTKNLYQVDSVNGMKESPEGDEIKFTKLVEAKQGLSVKKYAEGLLFTREAFINDDLSAFSLIPNKFVLDWNTLKGDLIWGLITSNAKVSDGKGIFHADHSNLATTAAILSDTSLEAALIALKNQTGIDGKRRIRIMPKYIIVSPDYEITALKLLTTISPNQVSQVNVFSSMGLSVIVEPRLTGKAWYLTTDPNAIDGLYYAYLDGNAGLRSNREEDFGTDSIKFAVRGEFGVAAIDYRGWYKNAGQ